MSIISDFQKLQLRGDIYSILSFLSPANHPTKPKLRKGPTHPKKVHFTDDKATTDRDALRQPNDTREVVIGARWAHTQKANWLPNKWGPSQSMGPTHYSKGFWKGLLLFYFIFLTKIRAGDEK